MQLYPFLFEYACEKNIEFLLYKYSISHKNQIANCFKKTILIILFFPSNICNLPKMTIFKFDELVFLTNLVMYLVFRGLFSFLTKINQLIK